MKVVVYGLNQELGSVFLDLYQPNAVLQINGNDNFKQFIKQLKQQMGDRQFIEELTTVLRSCIYAVEVEE